MNSWYSGSIEVLGPRPGRPVSGRIYMTMAGAVSMAVCPPDPGQRKGRPGLQRMDSGNELHENPTKHHIPDVVQSGIWKTNHQG